ncbi:hypothetical protein Acr_05g0016140 [Actinidia rufa]|uniref:DUF8204 domain-containing protein n=1 Tax=Actinidia rufa TaxID=165716 RepID=A0A7J0EN98_9ERIC|nr:hypothetical protein Acr_05g0016140 [Actinidia rufa]
MEYYPTTLLENQKIEACREGRSLTDFKYACVGYSLYSAGKDHSVDVQDTQAELPVCIGLEVLVDRTANAVDPAPAPVHNKEGNLLRSTFVIVVESLGWTGGDAGSFHVWFSRNASVVAMGVAKNLRKAGDRIKERLDDILYPYRRRPK